MSKQTIEFCRDIFERYLKMKELKFNPRKLRNPDRIVYKGGFSGFGYPYDSFDQVVVLEKTSIQSIIYLPAYATKNKTEIAEFISRVNYQLRFGHFEIDFDDGEIRFHFAQNTAIFSSEDANDAIEDQIFLPPTMMKRYAPGLVDVLQQNRSPEEAVRRCMATRDNV